MDGMDVSPEELKQATKREFEEIKVQHDVALNGFSCNFIFI